MKPIVWFLIAGIVIGGMAYLQATTGFETVRLNGLVTPTVAPTATATPTATPNPEILVSSYDDAGSEAACGTGVGSGDSRCATLFTLSEQTELTRFGVWARRVGSPGDATLEIQGVDGGTGEPNDMVTCTDTVSTDHLATTGGFEAYEFLFFEFVDCNLSSNSYFAVYSSPTGNGAEYHLWGRVVIDTDTHWFWDAGEVTPAWEEINQTLWHEAYGIEG